jgi:zinc finger SWIM domain-containing protein 3
MMANFKRPDPKKTPKALTRCGYTAHLEIELSAVSGLWFMKKRLSITTHSLRRASLLTYTLTVR